MVTGEDVEEWCVENECDIFMDGDFIYSDEQWVMFRDTWLNNLKSKFGDIFEIPLDEDWYENIWEVTNNHGSDINDTVLNIGFDSLAEWINKCSIVHGY